MVDNRRHEWPEFIVTIEILTSTDKPRQISTDRTNMQGTQATDSNNRASQSPSYRLLDKLTNTLRSKIMNRLE